MRMPASMMAANQNPLKQLKGSHTPATSDTAMQAAQEAHQENMNAGMTPVAPTGLPTQPAVSQAPGAINKAAAVSAAWGEYAASCVAGPAGGDLTRKSGSYAPAKPELAPVGGSFAFANVFSENLDQFLSTLSPLATLAETGSLKSGAAASYPHPNMKRAGLGGPV